MYLFHFYNELIMYLLSHFRVDGKQMFYFLNAFFLPFFTQSYELNRGIKNVENYVEILFF